MLFCFSDLCRYLTNYLLESSNIWTFGTIHSLLALDSFRPLGRCLRVGHLLKMFFSFSFIELFAFEQQVQFRADFLPVTGLYSSWLRMGLEVKSRTPFKDSYFSDLCRYLTNHSCLNNSAIHGWLPLDSFRHLDLCRGKNPGYLYIYLYRIICI